MFFIYFHFFFFSLFNLFIFGHKVIARSMPKILRRKNSTEEFLFVAGKFEDLTHSVGGDIFVLDDKTIYIQVGIGVYVTVGLYVHCILYIGIVCTLYIVQ